MKSKNSISQEAPHDNAASIKMDIPFNLTKASQYFAELEASCDEVIQKQDELIRKVTRRCRDIGQVAVEKPVYGPLVTSTGDPVDPRMPAKGASIMSESLAPMASQTFILQATVDEAEDIEQLEFEIIQLRQQMRTVEDEIVNYDPLTPTDIAKKMKFLAGLIADGGEVDMDAFARLVDTGADMLLTSLGEVGFF